CLANWMEPVTASALRLFVRRRRRRRIESWGRLGVPMAVYSDYPAGWKLESLGLSRLIPTLVCSIDADVASFKPAATGFHEAARRLALAASDVAYVGDREDVDDAGARNAGMTPVLTGRSKSKCMTLSELDTEL